MKLHSQIIRHCILILALALGLIQVANANPGGINSNLQLWLDADQAVTGTTTVSQWGDQSGKGKHVTQNTAGNQPALNLSLIHI